MSRRYLVESRVGKLNVLLEIQAFNILSIQNKEDGLYKNITYPYCRERINGLNYHCRFMPH